MAGSSKAQVRSADWDDSAAREPGRGPVMDRAVLAGRAWGSVLELSGQGNS